MLVLSRNIGETVRIGDDVFVKILDISGRHVRLGFVAPDEVNIVRTELIGKPRRNVGTRR